VASLQANAKLQLFATKNCKSRLPPLETFNDCFPEPGDLDFFSP